MKILFYCGIHNLVNFSRIRPFYDVCYGFDANPEKIEYARKFYSNDPNVKIIYGALTEKGGEEIEFVITTDWTPASSLGHPNPDFVHMKTGLLKAQKKIKVPTVNLYDFCTANGISEIDTLITDLQGIDLAVVKTMATFIKKGKIREIQCEVEPDHTPPRYLGIPTGKFREFNELLSGNYDVLWIDPENPNQSESAWEMDIRWRVKGGYPPDGIEFVMEKELLVPKNISVSPLISYSQYREDLVIDALFKHKSDGFYVDIGANDPEVLSNTKLFYGRGWRGINVEPEPNLHAKLCSQRTRDINIKAGVGPKPGIMTFYRMSADTLSSFNKQAALQAGKLYGGTLISEEQTHIVTLKELLTQHLNGRKIDFMSVDAEGYDLAVLESNDWSRFRPSVIIVEINVGGSDIIAFLQKQDYVLIFDNFTNGIFLAGEFCGTLDDQIKKELRELENRHGLRTLFPHVGEKDYLYINHVYGHQPPNVIKSFKRGNVNIVCTHLPLEGCDHYIYTNSFSYRGRMPGLNILLMLEPSVVLPGEYNEKVWEHFDHVYGLFDTLTEHDAKFHKILFPRADISGNNPVTDIQSLREATYPLSGRKNAICMIGSNRSSHVPYELYSRRVEAARWFAEHSRIPFDVYGTPFALPNYRGACPVSQKLSVMKQYRFNLCFENTNDPILSAGYVTEKILDCMESRTIPIYLGATNIEQYVPKSCFIDFREFGDYAGLEEYLQKLSEEEYQQYINAIDAWVTGGNLIKFAEAPLYNELARLCARASGIDSENIFGGVKSWTLSKPVPPTARQWQFLQTTAIWTWKHLSTAKPPLLENGKIVDRLHTIPARFNEQDVQPKAESILVGKKSSLRLLAAGAKFFSGSARQGYDYGWWNMFDALQHWENVEAKFFDSSTEAQVRGVAGMCDWLEELICKEKPDILFYYPFNSITGILPASLKRITDSTDTQTVIWMNNFHSLSEEEAKLWLSCADYIITTSNQSYRKYQEKGFGNKIIQSQWAFNPFTYPAEKSSKNRELSFIGSYGRKRSEMIDEIRQCGLPTDVFGNGWHEDSYISFYDMVKIFGQSKINLDLLHNDAFSAEQMKRRVFEITGCRGLVITHPADGLENYYEPEREVVCAASTEELIDKCRYYLAHETERDKIALRGYERTLKNHTWRHRFADIFRRIGCSSVLKSVSMTSGTLPVTVPRNEAAGSTDRQEEKIETTINVMAYNQLEYTRKCVESILHYTKKPYELLLTDNGSTDGTIEYFHAVKRFHPHTRIIRNFRNRVAETAVNHSTCSARGKYYVFVSNDTIVHEGWLENLIRQLESAPDIGWVGPRSNNISGPQLEPARYDTLETFQNFAAEWSDQHRGENFTVERLAGMLVITKKEYFERIGGADPLLPANGRDGGYGFSDDDISLRFRLAGYKLLVANDVYIHHFGSVSARQYRPDLFGTPQNLNREKYLRKIQNNRRITIDGDGRMTLRPYSLDDEIPVEERMMIRTPRVCFAETKCGRSGAADCGTPYSALATKYNGEVIRKQNESVQSLILRYLNDTQCDYLILIDSLLAPSAATVSSLTESALCHPDVALMVPVGSYAPSTHALKSDSAQDVEIIPYADLSICSVNLKIIRPLRSGLANCVNDDEFLWFLQRRVRGESYFIAKANDIEVNCNVPAISHHCDDRALPEQLIKEKRYGEAAAIYQDDLQKDPDFAEAYYQLARIAGEQGLIKEAVSQSEQALLADPHHIESLIFLSRLSMEQNDWKRAESLVRQANFKQPGNPDVQKIVEEYEKAIKENPGLLQTEGICKIPALTNAEFVKNRTSIIIAASSNYARECITAVKKFTREPYELIIIDDLASPESKKKLRKSVKEHNPYRIMELNAKDSILQSINKAINCSTGEYILLLNDDVIVSEGWLAGMLSCLNYAPAAGVIGPVTNISKGRQQAVDETYGLINNPDKYAVQFKKRYNHRRIACRNIARFCMLFKRSLAERIGLFDESFTAGQLEDEDFCWRAMLADYQNYIAGDVFVLHHGGKESSGSRSIIEKKWEIGTITPDGRKLAVLQAMELSTELYSQGKVDQAVAKLVDCIKITPEADKIYFELIRIFLETKKCGEAWAVIETMPEAAKTEIQTLEYSGYVKEGLGSDNEADEYADKVLSLSENNSAALNLKGVLAFKKGEMDKAKEYFKRAVDANPGYGDAYANLGVLYWKIDEREKAWEHIQKGFMLSPTVPDNQSLYHTMASSLGRFAAGEADFREACRLYPDNKNLAFLLIDLLLQQGLLNSAILKIEDALDTFGLDEGILNAALSVREKIGPLYVEQGKKNNTLSLCMIVKNEENNLVRCLKSIRSVVDEMIIVDTGSTDKTKVLAKIFGAKVYDFPWTGDFSAARNHSLAQATGDWILILDADEIISPLDHDELKKLVSRNHSSRAAYSIETRNYIRNESVLGWTQNDGRYPEEKHHGWITTAKVRLFPREKNVLFSNPVHEIVDSSLQKAAIPIFDCNVVVHHYGKLNLLKDMQKGEDYYLLGKMKYESDLTNVKYIYELAKQSHLLGKYEEAKELWLKLISILESDPQSENYQEIARVSESDPVSETYMQLATAYLAGNNFKEALSAARKAMEAEIKPSGSVYFYAITEIIAGSLQKAAAALKETMETNPDYSPASFLNAIIFCLSGEKDKARELFSLLRRKQFDLMTARLNNIAGQLNTSGRKKDALILLNAAAENKISDAETVKLLNQM